MLGNGAILFSCCLLSLGLVETLQKLTGMAATMLTLKTLKRLVYLAGFCVQVFLQGFAYIYCCVLLLYFCSLFVQNVTRTVHGFFNFFFLRGVSRTDAYIYLYFGFFILRLESGQCAFLDCSFPIKANVLLYTHRKHD